MDAETSRTVAAMLPPKTCLPRNYSCIAGLFGGLAAAASPSPRLDDGDDDDDFEPRVNGEPAESPVVDVRPRGREVLPKPPPPPQSPTLRRRCKSLPTPTERARLEVSRSRSPGSQKKVRFADSLGLELTAVKHFDDADVPEVPARILAKLSREPLRLLQQQQQQQQQRADAGGFPRTPAQPLLVELQFANPAALPGFERRVREAKVALESAAADECSLSGVVRVLNVAFEKSVALRYSLNDWITFMDSLAAYVPGSGDGVTDRFRFKIVMPTYLDDGGGGCGGGGALQFAIRYCVGGQEFWDNNDGKNYRVRRHRLKMSPPREWENGWIHFI